MPVTGIGGVFFRSSDPGALAGWYRHHFGIGAEGPEWQQSAGPTVFAPFAADTDYFAPDKHFMLNFRVSDLDSLLDALRADGIPITTNPEWDNADIGRFARIHDPEGNPIELWQPPPE